MDKFKKIAFAGITGVLGLLLVLSGLSLIAVSNSLSLYAGIILLIMAVLMYFLI
jgi:hypothetical protein